MKRCNLKYDGKLCHRSSGKRPKITATADTVVCAPVNVVRFTPGYHDTGRSVQVAQMGDTPAGEGRGGAGPAAIAAAVGPLLAPIVNQLAGIQAQLTNMEAYRRNENARSQVASGAASPAGCFFAYKYSRRR